MGISDNPRTVGNWAIAGLGGCSAIMLGLAAEGYAFSDEENALIEKFAYELLAIVGKGVPVEDR